MKLELPATYKSRVGDLLKPNKKYIVSASGTIKVTRHTYAGVEPFVAFVQPCDYIELGPSKVKTMLTVENWEDGLAFTVYVSEN
jgi:hypothetical protein